MTPSAAIIRRNGGTADRTASRNQRGCWRRRRRCAPNAPSSANASRSRCAATNRTGYGAATHASNAYVRCAVTAATLPWRSQHTTRPCSSSQERTPMADKPDRSLVLAHSTKEQADAIYVDSAKALRAYELRTAGTPWWDIAEELGVSERQAANLVAHKIASAARMVDDGVKQHLLAMEVERLDQLQRSVWDRALGGDLRAVDAVLRIITTRAKILGLEAATASTVTNNTIVVAGNTDEYIAALQRATHQEATDGD